MQRFKTHIPFKGLKDKIRVSDNYTVEIIYTQVQLALYMPYIKNDPWEAASNEEHYNTERLNNVTHFLVFRRNGFEDYPEKMTEGYPIDTYGTSLMLVEQSDIDGAYYNGLTRWNYGLSCGARDLDEKERFVSYENLKQITRLSDDKFDEIFRIWQKTVVNINKSTIDIPVGVDETFALNLNQDDLYNNTYIEERKQESVNKIVDYEKKQFMFTYASRLTQTIKMGDKLVTNTVSAVNDSVIWKNQQLQPVHEIDDNIPVDGLLHIANSLTFDIYLRDREVVNTYNIDGVTYYEYGDWNTDDGRYWNNNSINQFGFPEKIGGDPLGYLGFTDEDIYYQKDCVKKSFLRLAVYDSPLRQSQQLLYYSTLFLDTNKLYKSYVDYLNLMKGEKPDGQQYVYSDDSGLKASFTCSSKFKSDAASDGFYMYLFDGAVTGDTFTTLYLKIDFNNAKTGKTVPLIWPGENNKNAYSYVSDDYIRFSDVDRTTPALKKCPRSYEIQNGTERKVDMSQLLHDLYIPIAVKYDFAKKEYIWLIESGYERKDRGDYKSCRYNFCPKGDGNIRLELFEPRINGIE